MSVHHILEGFKIKALTWLHSDHGKSSPAEMMKDQLIVAQLFLYIICEIILPLLKSQFYITESAQHKNKTFFYRHTVWKNITYPLYESLKRRNFSIAAEIDTNSVEFSTVRFLPKLNGARPIVNMARRNYKAKNCYTKNQTLQNLFQVLNFEKLRHPDLLSSGVMGLDDIFRQIKSYSSRFLFQQQIPASVNPKFFFCKFDIQSCFDSIPHTFLFEIMSNVVQEMEYMVRKHNVSYLNCFRMKTEYRRTASTPDDFAGMIEYAEELSRKVTHAVIVDNVVYSFEDRVQLLRQLSEHIFKHYITIEGVCYRQSLGIPQGSIISSLLSNFFLAHLEQQELAEIITAESVLMRYVDDFLFITTDLSLAKRFCSKMEIGFPKYGIYMNVSKSLTNFDVKLSGRSIDQISPTLKRNLD
jgi:telomerase reverse transcriptase